MAGSFACLDRGICRRVRIFGACRGILSKLEWPSPKNQQEKNCADNDSSFPHDGFSLPSFLAHFDRLNAGRYTFASRFRCRSCERGYIFPRAPEQFVASPLCLVGYVRWDARSDRVPPLQTIIFSSFPGSRSHSGFATYRACG